MRKEQSVSRSVCFLHVTFILAAMSSPFNIIFTIQSDYTSYSFMSSHINDFIMCSIALRLLCFGSLGRKEKEQMAIEFCIVVKDGMVAHV